MIGAAGGLLEYLTRTQGRSATHVQRLRVFHPTDVLILDPIARRNLEITETLRGESSPTLLSVIDHCSTSAGGRLLRNWLQNPLRQRTSISARQRRLACLRGPECRELMTLLREAVDYERLATRLALHSIRPRELAALRESASFLDRLRARVSLFDAEVYADLLRNLQIDHGASEPLVLALHDDPAALVRDGGVIRRDDPVGPVRGGRAFERGRVGGLGHDERQGEKRGGEEETAGAKANQFHGKANGQERFNARRTNNVPRPTHKR